MICQAQALLGDPNHFATSGLGRYGRSGLRKTARVATLVLFASITSDDFDEDDGGFGGAG